MPVNPDRSAASKPARWSGRPSRSRKVPPSSQARQIRPPPARLNRSSPVPAPQAAQFSRAGVCPITSATFKRKEAARSRPRAPSSSALRPRSNTKNTRCEGSSSTTTWPIILAMVPATITASRSCRSLGKASITDTWVTVAKLRPWYKTRSTWVRGSSLAPKRLVVRRTPLATARTCPWLGLRMTTTRSASPKG